MQFAKEISMTFVMMRIVSLLYILFIYLFELRIVTQ